ncbi:unnamed protein product, partial [Cladocopium goreaui]
VSKFVLTEIQKDHHAAQLEQLLPLDDEEGEENESGEARLFCPVKVQMQLGFAQDKKQFSSGGQMPLCD